MCLETCHRCLTATHETCDGLCSSVSRAVHPSIRNLGKKSTLAYAHAHRSAEFLCALFFQLSAHLHTSGFGGERRFRFRHKSMSLDATVITLCPNLLPWTEYTRTKGGVELHRPAGHNGYWPTDAMLSNAKTPGVSMFEQTIRFASTTARQA
ncbi:MAG: hypothetical protein IH608_03060 [Proteobacteria bacterium]|nr:hypothetical protein [Pseudomonadota bacterium]